MSSKSPYDQIRFINDTIEDRKAKNEATYFSVKLEQFGDETPMVNKEDGSNFYETILQYLTRYDVSALIIELFHGKSPNIKTPFRTVKIPLKKTAEISLGNPKDEDLKITPSDSFISPEKHFFSMAEKERQVMLLQFDIKRLQYENEQLTRKNKKKKKYIEELEAELGRIEKGKKHSLGNVSGGMIVANALEQFAKSDFGMGLLQKGLGMKPEVLSGLLGTEVKEEPKDETKSTATVLSVEKNEPEKVSTEDEKKRQAVIKYINDFLNKANDTVLRLYYELIQLIGADTDTLKSIHGQVKVYREKQKAFIEQKLKESGQNTKPETERDSEEEHDDTS